MERDERSRPRRSPETGRAEAAAAKPQVEQGENAKRYGIDQVADKVKGLLRPPG